MKAINFTTKKNMNFEENKNCITKFPVLYFSTSEICLELTSFKIKGNILSPVL